MVQRIRVVGGPWPERIGQEGILVDRPTNGLERVYPWHGLGRDEVIVYLPDDPLARDGEPQRAWTCCMERTGVQLIPREGG